MWKFISIGLSFYLVSTKLAAQASSGCGAPSIDTSRVKSDYITGLSNSNIWTAILYCKSAYRTELTNEIYQFIQCINGTWTEAEKCVGCGPPTIDTSRLTSNYASGVNSFNGSLVTLTCKTRYRTQYTNATKQMIQCINETWTEEERCIGCGPPSDQGFRLESSYNSGTNSFNGSFVSLYCKVPLVTELTKRKEQLVQCLGETWTEAERCIGCFYPPHNFDTRSNFKIYENSSPGSKVTLTCKDGYFIRSTNGTEQVIQCIDGYTWTSHEECIPSELRCYVCEYCGEYRYLDDKYKKICGPRFENYTPLDYSFPSDKLIWVCGKHRHGLTEWRTCKQIKVEEMKCNNYYNGDECYCADEPFCNGTPAFLKGSVLYKVLLFAFSLVVAFASQGGSKF